MLTTQPSSTNNTPPGSISDSDSRQTVSLILRALDFLRSRQAKNSYHQVNGQSFNECVKVAGNAAELFFVLGNGSLYPTKVGDRKILCNIYPIWLTVLAQAVEFNISSGKEKNTLDWEVQDNLKHVRPYNSTNEENGRFKINPSILNCLTAASIYGDYFIRAFESIKRNYPQSNCNPDDKQNNVFEFALYQLPDSQLINKILELFIRCFQNDSSIKEQVMSFTELTVLLTPPDDYTLDTGNILQVLFSLPSINRLGVRGGPD
jgi:hypothetical protein